LHSIKRFKRGISAILVVGAALLAIGAGPASASVHWSDTSHGIKVAGTVKVTKNGQSKSCTAVSVQNNMIEPASAVIWSGEWGELEFKCETGILGINFSLFPANTTAVTVGANEFEEAIYPWYSILGPRYWQIPVTADFTNGTSSTPSKMSFVNDQIGYAPSNDAGWPMTLNGTLTVTTSTGGLLTLQP